MGQFLVVLLMVFDNFQLGFFLFRLFFVLYISANFQSNTILIDELFYVHN